MSKPSREAKAARKEKLLEPSNQTLYRFFNSNHELLYVGITNNPFSRFSGHSKDKSWFHELAYATFTHYPNRHAVDSAETRAIRAEKPKYNKAKTLDWERSPDHMRKIRMGKIKDHDMILGIMLPFIQAKGFGKDMEQDCWVVMNAIKHAKTLGHKCAICDQILIHKQFVQHYNRYKNKTK